MEPTPAHYRAAWHSVAQGLDGLFLLQRTVTRRVVPALVLEAEVAPFFSPLHHCRGSIGGHPLPNRYSSSRSTVDVAAAPGGSNDDDDGPCRPMNHDPGSKKKRSTNAASCPKGESDSDDVGPYVTRLTVYSDTMADGLPELLTDMLRQCPNISKATLDTPSSRAVSIVVAEARRLEDIDIKGPTPIKPIVREYTARMQAALAVFRGGEATGAHRHDDSAPGTVDEDAAAVVLRDAPNCEDGGEGDLEEGSCAELLAAARHAATVGPSLPALLRHVAWGNWEAICVTPRELRGFAAPLETLRMKQVKGPAMVAMVRCMPALRSLTITGTLERIERPIDLMAALAESCKDLRALDIETRVVIDAVAFDTLARGCPLLSLLHLRTTTPPDAPSSLDELVDDLGGDSPAVASPTDSTPTDAAPAVDPSGAAVDESEDGGAAVSQDAPRVRGVPGWDAATAKVAHWYKALALMSNLSSLHVSGPGSPTMAQLARLARHWPLLTSMKAYTGASVVTEQTIESLSVCLPRLTEWHMCDASLTADQWRTLGDRCPGLSAVTATGGSLSDTGTAALVARCPKITAWAVGTSDVPGARRASDPMSDRGTVRDFIAARRAAQSPNASNDAAPPNAAPVAGFGAREQATNHRGDRPDPARIQLNALPDIGVDDTGLTPDGLARALRRSGGATSLALEGTLSAAGALRAIIPATAHSLRELRLNGLQPGPRVLELVLETPGLRLVSLDLGSTPCDRDLLLTIARHQRGLEVLRCRNAFGFGDDTMAALATGCPGLTTLSLSCVTRRRSEPSQGPTVSSAGFLEFVRELPFLTRVSISGQGKLSESSDVWRDAVREAQRLRPGIIVPLRP